MEHEIKSAIIAAIWAAQASCSTSLGIASLLAPIWVVTNKVHDIETAADIATARIMRELEKPTHASQN